MFVDHLKQSFQQNDQAHSQFIYLQFTFLMPEQSIPLKATPLSYAVPGLQSIANTNLPPAHHTISLFLCHYSLIPAACYYLRCVKIIRNLRFPGSCSNLFSNNQTFQILPTTATYYITSPNAFSFSYHSGSGSL